MPVAPQRFLFCVDSRRHKHRGSQCGSWQHCSAWPPFYRSACCDLSFIARLGLYRSISRDCAVGGRCRAAGLRLRPPRWRRCLPRPNSSGARFRELLRRSKRRYLFSSGHPALARFRLFPSALVRLRRALPCAWWMRCVYPAATTLLRYSMRRLELVKTGTCGEGAWKPLRFPRNVAARRAWTTKFVAVDRPLTNDTPCTYINKDSKLRCVVCGDFLSTSDCTLPSTFYDAKRTIEPHAWRLPLSC